MSRKHTLSGFITDKNSGETIVGANVYCPELKIGVTSNSYGFYSLTLPEKDYTICLALLAMKPNKKMLIYQRTYLSI